VSAGRAGSRREEAGDYLYGIHPVAEALEKSRTRIERILVVREAGGGRIGRVLKKARLAGVPVSYLPKSVLARKAGPGAVHQGIAALVSGYAYSEAREVVEAATERGDGLILALDRVEDPRNLGAVARSAAAAGACGILLSSDATVGITPAAVKSSAGAVERIRIARDPDLPRTLDSLRGSGFEVVALDPGAGEPWDAPDWKGRAVIVAGGEEKGPRKKILGRCNRNVAIPLAAGVESLNISVAVGIVLYEAVRQRRRL
jgi:23S rRNA (guanosine2251-2'-O)-methyltransferase